MKEKSLFLLLLGTLGSGKGTQGKLLEKKYGVVHLACGDILREEVRKMSPLGAKVKGIMEKGGLVDNQTIIEVMTTRLDQPDCKNGAVIDGFPRTQVQAAALDEYLNRRHQKLLLAIHLIASADEIVTRLIGRLQCEKCGSSFHKSFHPPKHADACDSCGGKLRTRPDDREEVIRERLAVYAKDTAHLVDYYRGQNILADVQSVGDIDDVFKRLCSLIEEKRSQQR